MFVEENFVLVKINPIQWYRGFDEFTFKRGFIKS